MKLLILIVLSLFLVSCDFQIESNQGVTDLSKPNVSEVKEVVKIKTPNATKTNTSIKEEIPAKNVGFLNTSAYWYNQKAPISGRIKSKTHTIEVVDVDDESRGCLLKIDGITVLVDEDESATVNDLKIHVLDVRAFKSYTEDKDACQIIIT